MMEGRRKEGRRQWRGREILIQRDTWGVSNKLTNSSVDVSYPFGTLLTHTEPEVP